MKTAKEVGEALKRRDSTITIEGDLSKKVFRIHATGVVAWGVCVGALGVAITATIMSLIPDPAEPAEIIAAGISAGCATAILGSATAAAIAIGTAAGGVSGLNLLRSYKVVSNTSNQLILQR